MSRVRSIKMAKENTNVPKHLHPTMLLRPRRITQPNEYQPVYHIPQPVVSKLASKLDMLMIRKRKLGVVLNKDRVEQPVELAATAMIIAIPESEERPSSSQDKGQSMPALIPVIQHKAEGNMQLDIVAMAMPCRSTSDNKPPLPADQPQGPEDDNINPLIETCMDSDNFDDRGGNSAPPIDAFVFTPPLPKVQSRPSININDDEAIAALIKPFEVDVTHTEDVSNIIKMFINSCQSNGAYMRVLSPGVLRTPGKRSSKRKEESNLAQEFIPIPSRRRNLTAVFDLEEDTGAKKIKMSEPEKQEGRVTRRLRERPKKSSTARFQEEERAFEDLFKSSLHNAGFGLSFPDKKQSELNMSALESKVVGFFKAEMMQSSSTCSKSNQEKTPRWQRSKYDVENLESYTVSGRKFDENGVEKYYCVWNDGYGSDRNIGEENDSQDMFYIDEKDIGDASAMWEQLDLMDANSPDDTDEMGVFKSLEIVQKEDSLKKC